jgi:predicted transcriptional regulator
MTKLTIKTATEQDFFARGKVLAKAADSGHTLPNEHIVSFEDAADLIKLMSTTKLALFREIKQLPGSITDIAGRLHRDRSAVKRDIDELARAGLVIVSEKPLPGHGRMKEIRASAQQIHLQAIVG